MNSAAATCRCLKQSPLSSQLQQNKHTFAFVRFMPHYQNTMGSSSSSSCSLSSTADAIRTQHQDDDTAADAVARYHALSQVSPLPPPQISQKQLTPSKLCACVICAQLWRHVPIATQKPYNIIKEGGGAHAATDAYQSGLDYDRGLCCTACVLDAPPLFVKKPSFSSLSLRSSDRKTGNDGFFMCPKCTRRAVHCLGIAKR